MSNIWLNFANLTFVDVVASCNWILTRRSPSPESSSRTQPLVLLWLYRISFFIQKIQFIYFFIENPAIMGCEVEILLEIPLLIQLICGRRNLLFVFCNCLLDAFVICIHWYVPCGYNYITNIVRDTTRKKVHFGRTMHCLPQSLKSTFFQNFFILGLLAETLHL